MIMDQHPDYEHPEGEKNLWVGVWYSEIIDLWALINITIARSLCEKENEMQLKNLSRTREIWLWA